MDDEDNQILHNNSDNEASSSGDEDGPDWTKLPSAAPTSLPKRGDKEFEPAADGPTNLQTHSLKRARDAMFGALGTERGINNKSVSYAVWYPTMARAHVTQARGVLFHGMGHSAGRPAGDSPKILRRTELLPEETLYLIERGSLFCWKDAPTAHPHPDAGEHDMQGSPMSVQQAFVEMIGREDLTLERYHAFAYLKRLGFNVLRTNPPSSSYPTPPPVITPQTSFLSRLFRPLRTLFTLLVRRLSGGIDWWKPLGYVRDYASMYRSLRFIPSGHNVPLHVVPGPPALKPPDTPYEIFYNVYKPNTPFKKSAPPPPDFSLVIVNARTTALPSIHELTHLWSSLPESGPPPPRQRNRPKPAPNPNTPAGQPSPASVPPPTLPSRLLSWFGWKQAESKKGARPPHPFAVLKAGKKTVVVGAVDSGTVGFFRFGMGEFEEMPLI